MRQLRFKKTARACTAKLGDKYFKHQVLSFGKLVAAFVMFIMTTASPVQAQLSGARLDPDIRIPIHSIDKLKSLDGPESWAYECLTQMFPRGARLPIREGATAEVSTGAGSTGNGTDSANIRTGILTSNVFIGAVSHPSPRRNGYTHQIELWNVTVDYHGNQNCTGFQCSIKNGDLWFEADVLFHVWRKNPQPNGSNGTCSSSLSCMDVDNFANASFPDLLRVGETMKLDAGGYSTAVGWRRLIPSSKPNGIRLFASGNGKLLHRSRDGSNAMSRDFLFTQNGEAMNITFPSAPGRRYDITIIYSRRNRAQKAIGRFKINGLQFSSRSPYNKELVWKQLKKAEVSSGNRATIKVGGINTALNGLVIKRVR